MQRGEIRSINEIESKMTKHKFPVGELCFVISRYNGHGDDMGSIKQALNELNVRIKVRGTMPGHKGRLAVDGAHDVTELPGADNLQQPKGILREAEREAARIYGVADARYLVNGSTSGNLTLVFSFFEEGDEILVERNCHKSVYNALVLRKLRPVYLWPKQDARGSSLPQDSKAIREALEEHPQAKGVLLTMPSYKGLVSDIEAIYRVVHEADAVLILDAAHGAALAGMDQFHDFYRSCDAMVISTHKSLACLNQGALILSNRPDLRPAIQKYSNMFQTTSPSYLIMESIESSVEEVEAGRYLDPPVFSARDYQTLTVNPELTGYRMDPWKLLLVHAGQGNFMEQFLEGQGIFPEMHDQHSVLLMLSPSNSPEEIQWIRECLIKLDELLSKISAQPERESQVWSKAAIDHIPRPRQHCLPWQAGDRGQDVLLDEACGRIAQEQVIPYPPGVPVLLPGEVIDEAMIRYLKQLKANDIEILGLTGNQLTCVEE